jgi:aspartate/methionine/tyrosine aminotransferase
MNSGSTHHNWNGCGLIGKTYWNHVVRSAKERNFCFEITIEEAWQQFVKQGGRCSLTNWPICFAPPSNPTGATASLDRINSLGNYTLDNIQWLHKDVNYMKNDYEQSRLIEVAHAIAANNPIPQGSSKC